MSRLKIHSRVAGTTGQFRCQRGLTLIELMVALTLSLLVAGVAIAVLLAGRQGFTSVDEASQLRENARFTADLIQRLAVQAGFEDVAGGMIATVIGPNAYRDPSVLGADNSVIPALTALPVGDSSGVPSGIVNGSRPGSCTVTDTSCANGSDVLVLRFWGTAGADMINCAGRPETVGAFRSYSIFHVVRSVSGEPTLACTYRTAAGAWATELLVQGVEAFQVLYGVAGVQPGNPPTTAALDAPAVPISRYVAANQMTVAGNTAATINNWRLVRSLRIGLMFRGQAPVAVDRSAASTTMPILAERLDDYPGSTADPLVQLPVAQDGRLRQRMVIDVHLRNTQK